MKKVAFICVHNSCRGQIAEALLELNECDPVKIFGVPDNYKLCSSMTLFDCVAEDTDVFSSVIDKFFGGKKMKRR